MLAAISDPDLWNKINKEFGNGGGIYKVIATRNAEPIVINRFLGSDKEGILYIGKAACYVDRVINLKKATDPKYVSSGHEFGLRYKGHESIKLAFPYEALYIKLEKCDDIDVQEHSALEKYYKTYGELPPLNRQQGKVPTQIVMPNAQFIISSGEGSSIDSIES